MVEILELPSHVRIAGMNRLASTADFSDPQEEAIASLEILFRAAEEVRKIPSDVLDSVMIARPYTGYRPVETDRYLDAVIYECVKAQHWLRRYRANKATTNESEKHAAE